MAEQAYYDFYAPVFGVATKFSMRCNDGLPKKLMALAPLHVEFGTRGERLYLDLDLVNHLLRDIPWAALRMCKRGNLGAVIEAAEARRAEIYGPLTEAA